MKDEQLDSIMKKHKGNNIPGIDIEQAVMGRILEYEERKSARFFLWEYVLSGLVLFSGLISILVMKYVFTDYAAVFDWYSLYASTISWFSVILFTVIVLSVILFTYYISVTGTGRETAREQV